MASSMDFTGIGSVHYYAISVYILFFVGVILTCRKRLFPVRKKQAREKSSVSGVAIASQDESKLIGLRHRNNLGKNVVTLNDDHCDPAMGLSASKQVADRETGTWIPPHDLVLNGGTAGTYLHHSASKEGDGKYAKLDSPSGASFGLVSEIFANEACYVSQEYVEELEYVVVEEQVISECFPCGTVVTCTTLSRVAEDAKQMSSTTSSHLICKLAEELASEIVSESLQSESYSAVAAKEKSGKPATFYDINHADDKTLSYKDFADRLFENILSESVLQAAEAISSSNIQHCSVKSGFKDVLPDCICRLADNQAEIIMNNVLEHMQVFYKKRSSIELYASNLSQSVIQSSIHMQDSSCAEVQDIKTMAASLCEQLMHQICCKVKESHEDELNNNMYTECEERTSVDSGIDERRLDSSMFETKDDVYLSSDSPVNLPSDNEHLLSNIHTNERTCGDIPLDGFAKTLASFLSEDDDGSPDFIESDEDSEDEELRKLDVTFELQQQKIHVRVSDCNEESKSKQDSVEVRSGLFEQMRPKKGTQTKLKGDRPLSTFAQDMLEDFLDDEQFIEDDPDVSSVDEVDPSCSVGNRNSIQAKVEFLESKLDLVSSVQASFDEYILDDVRRESLGSMSQAERTMPVRGHKLKTPVVIDLGCGVIKAGLAGQRTPQCYCPSVIGVPRRFSQEASKMTKAFYVGDEAWSLAGMLQISYPVKPNITIWSDVSSFLEHFLEHELCVSDGEHPVLLTELARAPVRQREKLTEIMFERFGVPGFYLANQGTLSLNSMGLSSGLCLNLGFSCTQAIPVYESHVIDHAVTTLDVGGDHVTEYLGRLLLGNQGLAFSTSSEKLLLNQIKEQLGYIAKDPWQEQESYKQDPALHETYTMPDGQEIPIGTERFVAGEILFDPKRLGLNQQNVAEMLLQSISLLDVDLHGVMSKNILVTGGGSRLPGFGDRLEQELNLLTQGSAPAKLRYADNPSVAAWVGGSVLTSIPSFESQWMSMESYAEHGSKLVRKVCF